MNKGLPFGGVSRLKRPTLRALLLAPAVIVAAVALAGCNADSIAPNGRATAPLSSRMLSLISEKNMDKGSPILVRLFKEESEMEVWKQTRDGTYALLKTYPICKWSGELGPKKKEGDRQAPEGFYAITPALMNPNSNYYLSFNTGYPNAYDRAWGRTGSELMVHGDCSSRGCYAMTDEQIQEIYALARESFFGGQKEFQLEAFPFRMTALNMAKHRNNPNFAFWKMLKEGYDDFNATHQEPKVAVCEKHYVFDAAAPENASHPLSFSPRGKCPAYRLDPVIADTVLDHRRQEQLKMARYIADGVATVPIHRGVDGGMNPVFAAKFGSPDFDNNGRVLAASSVPGALPHVPNPPATAIKSRPASPVRMASAPAPTAATQAKRDKADGKKPAAIASLFGNLFGHSSASDATAKTASGKRNKIALRGSQSEPVTRHKRPAPVIAHRQPKTEQQAEAVAGNVPEAEHKPKPAPVVKEAAARPKSDQPNPAPAASASERPIRSAYSEVAGAPILPTSSFEARWAGLH